MAIIFSMTIPGNIGRLKYREKTIYRNTDGAYYLGSLTIQTFFMLLFRVFLVPCGKNSNIKEIERQVIISRR